MEYLDPQPELVAVASMGGGEWAVYLRHEGDLFTVHAEAERNDPRQVIANLRDLANREATEAAGLSQKAAVRRQVADALHAAFLPAPSKADGPAACQWCGEPWVRKAAGGDFFRCGTRTSPGDSWRSPACLYKASGTPTP